MKYMALKEAQEDGTDRYFIIEAVTTIEGDPSFSLGFTKVAQARTGEQACDLANSLNHCEVIHD